MAREWWRRLPAAERREYERSEGISRVPLAFDPAFPTVVAAIERSLASEDRPATEKAAQALVDRLSRGLAIPSATIRVQGRRPADGDGELHGIYRPAEGSEPDRIHVWMRTAKRKDVVAIKTFLRTLLHEVGHHIDMRLLDLPNSYHSKGFYQRESSLFRVVTRGTGLEKDAKPAAGAEPAATLRRSPPPRPKADVQRGLALLRAAIDDIEARSKRS